MRRPARPPGGCSGALSGGLPGRAGPARQGTTSWRQPGAARVVPLPPESQTRLSYALARSRTAATACQIAIDDIIPGDGLAA